MSDWKNLLVNDVDAFNAEIDNVPEEQRTMFRATDLSGLDLIKARTYYLDLTESNLKGTRVDGGALATCKLENTILDDLIVDDPYWSKEIEVIARLWKGAEIWNASKEPNIPIVLANNNFSGARFDEMDLSDVSFTHCAFPKGRFVKVDLKDASFNGSNMAGTIFEEIQSRAVSFQRADLSGSKWAEIELKHSKFNEANLVKASMKKMKFWNTSFIDAKCMGASFEDCHFKECLFFDTDFTGAKFVNCQFEDSEVEYAIIEGVIGL